MMALMELKKVVDEAVKNCGGKEAAADMPVVTNEPFETVGSLHIYGVKHNGHIVAYKLSWTYNGIH